MKRKVFGIFAASVLLLTGCSFLNREYSSIEAHSATYYESEDRSVLRAESYQDLVNDLLLLVTGHKEQGKIHLTLADTEPDRETAMERATLETQTETPLGAYAVDYITYTQNEDGSLIDVNIGYRRSTEQMAGIVRGNSIAALHNLLTAAVENGAEELVIQVGYFQGQTEEVAQIMEQVRQEQQVTAAWQVNYYPNDADVGIIEIMLSA